MSFNPSDPQGAPADTGASGQGDPASDRGATGRPDRPERPERPGSGGAGLGPDAHQAAAAYAKAADAAARVDDAATGEGRESVDPDTPAAPRGGGGQPATPAQPETPGQPPDAAHEAVQRDLEELAAKAEKAEEYLGLAQRTKADFENFRKRAARESRLAQERGIAKLAKELLPAIDNLDRAVQAAATYGQPPATEAAAVAPAAAEPLTEAESPTGTHAPAAEEAPAGAGGANGAGTEQQLVSGIRLVHADVLQALARVGIEPFSPAGEAFDPQHHEAVAQAPVPGQAPGTVVEVYQQGYRLGETVLRPARVLVAQ